jgi:hypothetical protein
MEVHFYFTTSMKNYKHLAIGRLYSKPDLEKFQKSFGTYKQVRMLGDDTIIVVDVKAIKCIVAVIPEKANPGCFFVGERPALKLCGWIGELEPEDDEE